MGRKTAAEVEKGRETRDNSAEPGIRSLEKYLGQSVRTSSKTRTGRGMPGRSSATEKDSNGPKKTPVGTKTPHPVHPLQSFKIRRTGSSWRALKKQHRLRTINFQKLQPQSLASSKTTNIYSRISTFKISCHRMAKQQADVPRPRTSVFQLWHSP